MLATLFSIQETSQYGVIPRLNIFYDATSIGSAHIESRMKLYVKGMSGCTMIGEVGDSPSGSLMETPQGMTLAEMAIGNTLFEEFSQVYEKGGVLEIWTTNGKLPHYFIEFKKKDERIGTFIGLWKEVGIGELSTMAERITHAIVVGR